MTEHGLAMPADRDAVDIGITVTVTTSTTTYASVTLGV